jgi:hypothetical protein
VFEYFFQTVLLGYTFNLNYSINPLSRWCQMNWVIHCISFLHIARKGDVLFSIKGAHSPWS